MEQQASTTNPGASNARDFQPETRNPQTAPGNLFPQAGGVQPTGSEDLLQNSNARITVPDAPDTSRPQVAEAKSSNGLLIGGVIAVVVVGLLLSRLMRRKGTHQASRAVDYPALEVEAPEPVQKTQAAVVKKSKTTPKKSKSQRKKRARK